MHSLQAKDYAASASANSAAARLSYASEHHEPASKQNERCGFRDIGGKRGEALRPNQRLNRHPIAMKVRCVENKLAGNLNRIFRRRCEP